MQILIILLCFFTLFDKILTYGVVIIFKTFNWDAFDVKVHRQCRIFSGEVI